MTGTQVISRTKITLSNLFKKITDESENGGAMTECIKDIGESVGLIVGNMERYAATQPSSC
jgi:hypothetical protein